MALGQEWAMRTGATCDCGEKFCTCQTAMFDRAHARKTDPDTSKQAASDLIGKERLSRLQMKALVALETLGGSGINDEVVEASKEDWRSITPRMKPLERKNLVRRNGARKAASGSDQTVWELTIQGRAAVLLDTCMNCGLQERLHPWATGSPVPMSCKTFVSRNGGGS